MDTREYYEVSEMVSHHVYVNVSTLVLNHADDWPQLFNGLDYQAVLDELRQVHQPLPGNPTPADIRDAMEACSWDDQDFETAIYEHWIVSDWLAHRLEQRGELIERDFYGLTVWGRGTTGQAIALDSVICEIYRDQKKLYRSNPPAPLEPATARLLAAAQLALNELELWQGYARDDESTAEAIAALRPAIAEFRGGAA